MEIKILVAENRESDLDNFIKDCEIKGFELQNRGGGHMPNFSGYYATLKGSRWEPIKSDQALIEKLEAEKKELVDLYKECFERFIPIEYWDEATEFLSTAKSGLAKELLKKKM